MMVSSLQQYIESYNIDTCSTQAETLAYGIITLDCKRKTICE